MPLLLVVALLSGALTVLTPCVLPVLPIFLAIGGGRTRWQVLLAGLGFATSFFSQLVLLATVVRLLPVPADAFRWATIAVLCLVGLMLLVQPLRQQVATLLAPFHISLPACLTTGSSPLSALAAGVSAGFLCVPCAGPILSAVAVLATIGDITWHVVWIALAFTIGLALPLLAVAWGWQGLRRRLRWFTRFTEPVAGFLLLATGVGIALGLDLQAQIWAAQATGWVQRLQGIESQPAVVTALAQLRGANAPMRDPLPRLGNYGRAPSFVDIQSWLNSAPLRMAQLRGKVVLIDFWTYSCVNCVREIPHVEAWYQRYRSDGLMVIGVHSPEFAFERDPHNVASAVRRFAMTYPVALDPTLATWRAYQAIAWPELYLIDKTGTIRYIHIGEGEYATTEDAIRTLLTEAGYPVAVPETEVPDRTPRDERMTPELYLGAWKLHQLASPQTPKVGTVMRFSVPQMIPPNEVAFSGLWQLQEQDAAEQEVGAAITVNFLADRVYVVAGTSGGAMAATIYLDGKPVADSFAGVDVRSHHAIIDNPPRLYRLVDLHQASPTRHLLTLRFEQPGVRLYSFTFG